MKAKGVKSAKAKKKTVKKVENRQTTEDSNFEKEKKTLKACGNCSHDTSMHYGSPERWCNESNCQCFAWTECA